ncbi:MAG TPA: hypothetical protein VFR90_09690 [Methylibium sp.]|uniref:hypothetical protein n=1 Tax=Methylibium sp. TaxID=2067992 RepID=UPI002DB6E68F|nr:hypothetical protein [Methylibium sp.]HEU4459381.1 hypothetical protein [Methylibium sp.]
MQPVPAEFERDTAGTEAEWLARLPGACHGHALELGPSSARVGVDAGWLRLHWRVLPPRRIALLSMPRMAVAFRFDGVDAAGRERFMRRFDLQMQRGGG